MYRAASPRRRRAAAWLVGVLGAVAAGAPSAQTVTDDAIAKARLLAALVRFVQWPPEAFAGDGAPLQLCVVHDSAAVAAAIRDELHVPLAGRAWAPSFHPRAPRAGTACHVLYVDESAGASAAGESVRHAAGPTLTIGQRDGFVAQGGMVEIVVADAMLRFDVNLGAMQQAGLGMRAGALKLARAVLR